MSQTELTQIPPSTEATGEASVANKDEILQFERTPEGEIIPRLKTKEEMEQSEGFLPPGVEAHHTDEQVAERLFKVDMPNEIKSLWGWAQSSLNKTSITTIAEKALKSAEDIAETVKESAGELAENVKTKGVKALNARNTIVSNQENCKYPWEPETRFSSEIRERVMMLSDENNTFLVPPPKEVNFLFDFETNADAAILMLGVDARLKKKRFELVPRQLDESSFWRNYFYRVELIKRSYGADLTSAEDAARNSVTEAVPETEESAELKSGKDDGEVDAKLLDDNDSIDFEPYESKKGQRENKRSGDKSGELSWEEELAAEVESDNFDMLNEEEILDDKDNDSDYDSDLEERIKAELNMRE